MGRETTYTRQLSILLYGICTDEKVHNIFWKKKVYLFTSYLFA